MPNIVEIQGVKSLQRKLKDLANKSKREDEGTVVVGYTQNYAVYVHEDMTAAHKVGQAKYLEQPARDLSSQLGAIAAKAVSKGAPLRQGLLIAGLRLQRESQQMVPIDTTALKGSAFTDFEENLEQVAALAYKRSEQIRQAALSQRAATAISSKPKRGRK